MSISLLEVLYELTLFTLLCLLLYNMTKTYVLPMLRGAINEEKEHSREIAQKTELLQDTTKRITKDMHKQDMKLATLEEKIRTWHAARLKKVQEQEAENKKISTEMLETKQLQRANFHAQRVRLEVVPEALIEAHGALADILSGDQGIKLLNDLLVDIKRRACEQVEKQ